MAESKSSYDDVDDLCVKTIGVFCADMVEKANSGHPGAPMGMAAVSHVLWSKIMTASSSNPSFINRDRFVLSNGHGCTLQYTMLHLCGYKVSMDDLKNFRQLNSKTPGHPENFLTEGIEVSTGPLGQGLAQSVGMAIAEKHLSSVFSDKDINLFDHHIYAFCGDGCMQEGVSSEACSLAGHLKLDNLIVIYDDNNITIDGDTSLSFTENVGERFKAYGWNVLSVANGNKDLKEIENALNSAKANKNSPTLICLKTKIGYGSLKENSEKAHGSPLGKDALADYKKKMGFKENESFIIDDKVYKQYIDTFQKRGKEAEIEWNKKKENFSKKYPEKGKLLDRLLTNKLPENWEKCLPKFDENSKAAATRNINGDILNEIVKVIPEIIGGAADLTPSTKTALKCSYDFQGSDFDKKPKFSGRYLRFGVREFGMFCIGNGLSSYGANIIPFTSTFLNFLTYGFGAVRLGALSHLRHIYIMTHDSVLLGEDGPTHQPVEVIPACRATPNLCTFRPCDGNEINAAWKFGLNYNGPTVICLSRQKVNIALLGKATKLKCNDMANGAYILQDVEEKKDLDAIIIGTGSEVELALEAANNLKESDKLNIRVVSALCLEEFNKKDLNYKQSVLKPNVLVMSIEASSSYGWSTYSHRHFGVDTFGASAPLSAVREHFGLNGKIFTKNVSEYIQKWKNKQAPLLPCLYE